MFYSTLASSAADVRTGGRALLKESRVRTPYYVRSNADASHFELNVLKRGASDLRTDTISKGESREKLYRKFLRASAHLSLLLILAVTRVSS